MEEPQHIDLVQLRIILVNQQVIPDLDLSIVLFRQTLIPTRLKCLWILDKSIIGGFNFGQQIPSRLWIAKLVDQTRENRIKIPISGWRDKKLRNCTSFSTQQEPYGHPCPYLRQSPSEPL